MGRWNIVAILVAAIAVGVAALSPLAASSEEPRASHESIAAMTPSSGEPASAPVQAAPLAATVEPLDGVDLSRMELDGGRYVQRLEAGRTAVFTMDVELQRFAMRLLDQYQVPAGAVVVLNSRTGRVLTLAQQRLRPDSAELEQVALDASPPAASVFKIVTAAALLEQAHLSINTSTCYRGGSSKLLMEHLRDIDPSQGACASIEAALGRSINAIFAKLSDRHLDREILARYAERFGFGRPLPFDVELQTSGLEIPDERLERARASAGFWHTHLSPLHAATMAQSLAQDGAMLRPYVVDEVHDDAGAVLYQSAPKYLGKTVEKETARALVGAMAYTVEKGTARKGFKDPKGVPFLPGVRVAGKTGTLTGAHPYRAYSWFVGVAPVEDPEVAIAVLIVNEPKWRIKSSTAAAQILKKYFESKTANR